MRILTTFCAAALAIAGTARAQSSIDRITAQLTVPVSAAGATLPAGECTIQVLRGSSDAVTLVMRSQSGQVVSLLANRFNDRESDTNGRANLVLNRHGNEYQLDKIILPDHTGFQVVQ
jgi:hypothetical protein